MHALRGCDCASVCVCGAQPPVDYIDEALPLPPAARPPVDPDESEFDSTHDEYDDEYALDLGGYW